MRGSLPALAAALLLPALSPLLMGSGASASGAPVTPAAKAAENPETIAAIARAISVRIDATETGAGVLVR